MNLKTPLLSLVAFISASSAFADVVLAPRSPWEYSADGGATWLPGNAPFGNTGDPDFGYTSGGTFWPDNTDISVRTTFDLTGFDLSTVFYDLGVDNGFDLFVNGNHVAGANAEGFTFKWEYSGQIPQGDLNSGVNSIVVDLEDHGGLTAFDMQITARQLPSVPDGGSSVLLVGGAFTLLAGLRKRLSDRL